MHAKDRNSSGNDNKRRYRLTVVIAKVVTGEFYCDCLLLVCFHASSGR